MVASGSEIILASLDWVLLALAVLVGLHLGYVALGRSGMIRTTVGRETVLLAVLSLVGAIGLLEGLRLKEGVGSEHQWLLEVGGLCLYGSGYLIYVEAKSLFARGYSLRILVDLLSRGGTAPLASLKSNYGDGMGVSGILTKRLTSLLRLGLLRFEGDQVGPLTLLGKACAAVGGGVRQLLRLDLVGQGGR